MLSRKKLAGEIISIFSYTQVNLVARTFHFLEAYSWRKNRKSVVMFPHWSYIRVSLFSLSVTFFNSLIQSGHFNFFRLSVWVQTSKDISISNDRNQTKAKKNLQIWETWKSKCAFKMIWNLLLLTQILLKLYLFLSPLSYKHAAQSVSQRK